MATRIVRAVADSGRPMTDDDLVPICGAAGAGDAAFQLALRLTALEGLIAERNGSWWPTDLSDSELDGSEHAREVEAGIVKHVEAVGLVERDELAGAVGVSASSVEFRAGLERALASGRVSWLAWSLYGVPAARLRELSPPESDPPEAERPDLARAALAASGALREISRKFAATDRSGAQDETLQKLETLAKLKETGVITNEEFSAKKADLLARL